MPRRVEDYIGKKIHHLTILEDLGTRGPNFARRVLVQCDCEKQTIKEINFGCLFGKQQTKSCGCVKMKNILNSNLSHGMSYTKEHKCWAHMKARCYDINDNRYYRYGGRGITVCDRWKNSFESFIEDMGMSPSPKHSVDRIDIDKNYERSNCRWATAKEQANNASSNRMITYEGKTQTLAQWSDETGIKRTTISMRIDSYGWTIEEALSVSPIKGSANHRRTSSESVTDLKSLCDNYRGDIESMGMTDSSDEQPSDPVSQI
jgi:hypothetical protein